MFVNVKKRTVLRITVNAFSVTWCAIKIVPAWIARIIKSSWSLKRKRDNQRGETKKMKTNAVAKDLVVHQKTNANAE